MKQNAIAIAAAGALIVGVLVFKGQPSSGLAARAGDAAALPGGNVSVVDGRQIVEITVKGGYSPVRSVAKAGLPTVLRFKTNGTFDCSSALVVPSLGVSQLLSQTGVFDVDAGTPAAGQLAGSCSMGMYRFAVDFQA